MTTITIDSRPDGIDHKFWPGNKFKIDLPCSPAGILTGRTFTSSLGAVTLDVTVNGDVISVEATEAHTQDAAQKSEWSLDETTSGTPNTLLTGTWERSRNPNVSRHVSHSIVFSEFTATLEVGTDAGLKAHKDSLHREYVTRPSGFGESFYAALGEADTRLVRIGFVGDSTLCGLFSNDHYLAFVGLIRTWFQSRYGDGGSGWLDWFNSSIGGFGGPGGPDDGDTTQTGAWTDVPGGVNGNSRRPTVAGNGATMTFHPRGTTLDIVSRVDPTFGRYDRQIDGGSVVQVPQNLAAAVQVNQVAVSPGSHSLLITAAAGQCRFHGVRGRNATGVLVDNFSIGGRSMVSQNLGLNVAAEGLAGQTTLSTTFDVMPPLDLLVWQLGVNDAVSIANPNYDTMWSLLNDTQREIRAAGVDVVSPPEVVVMIPHISGFADTSVPYKWPRIVGILKDWAASINAGVVDMWAAGRNSGEYAGRSLVDTPPGLGWFGFGVGDVHLAAPGSQAYMNGLLSLIDPAQA